MSVLQLFTSLSGPPVPPSPPAARPTATSLRQQLIQQVGAPPHAALLWRDQWRVFPEHVFTDPTLRGSKEPQVITYFYRPRAPSPAECIPILGGAKPREQATELHYTFWEVSFRQRLADSALRTLEQAYVLEDRSAIPAFIEQNRLLELLLVAREPLTSAFGEGTMKKLTLVEDDEGFITLFCFVMLPSDLEEARRALHSFDESWWLAHSHEAGGKLNFDFDLI